jgi:hypothetical protein
MSTVFRERWSVNLARLFRLETGGWQVTPRPEQERGRPLG